MASSPRLGPHELYAYEPPVSLWSLVESYVPQHEWQEVKCILGESMVEQSLELHEEIQTLLEIWRDYRNETENQPMYHRLPEPPAARERLKQEIKFFIDNIRQKSNENGWDFKTILSKHNKDVLDYVFDTKRPASSCGSRPTTACSSRDGRETPMTITTPDRLCKGSAVSDEVNAMQDKLNFLCLDDVLQHLRATLEEEVKCLVKDTDFLQQCLNDEMDFRSEPPALSREPTLSDLREERTKLEKEMLSTSSPLPVALRDDLPSPPIKNPSLLIRSGSDLSKRLSPPSSAGLSRISARPGPLKASHDIPLSPHPPASSSHSSARTESPNSDVKREVSNKENSPGSQAKTQIPVSPTDLPKQASVRPRVRPAPANHTLIRAGGGPSKATVVKVGSIGLDSKELALHAPCPPNMAKPSSARPGSAQRFRKMVQECREGT